MAPVAHSFQNLSLIMMIFVQSVEMRIVRGLDGLEYIDIKEAI